MIEVMKRFLLILMTSLALPFFTFAQSVRDTYVGEFISTVLTFIQSILLPLAFAIAFLMFLVNTVRYFLIESTSEEGRTKAKRSALLSIAAFVFLVSLWTVVTLLMASIGLSSNTEADCPDYIERFGGSCGSLVAGDVTPGGAGGSGTPFTAPDRGGSSGGGSSGPGNGGGNASGSEDDRYSALAELVFGSGHDQARGVTNNLAPSAVNATPALTDSNSCETVIDTLKRAATIESTQAAYALVTSNDSLAWHNISEQVSSNVVTFDLDYVDTFFPASDPSEVHLFHIHPDSRPDNLGLLMNGHGPSGRDMLFGCSYGLQYVQHHVVDEGGVWTIDMSNMACATDISLTPLQIIETYGALSVMDTTARQRELEKYIESDLTNNAVDTEFSNLLETKDVSAMSSTALRNESTAYQLSSNLNISYEDDVTAFCSQF